MPFLLDLAWRDLRHSGRSLWIFCACLVLGVSLVAAGGGLYRQVADALRSDARLLFGGDVEVEYQQPLPADVLAWMNDSATVSRLVELRTMLRTASGQAQLIELQSTDAQYPLYGEVTLAPASTLDAALAQRGQDWGAAVDAALATRLNLQPGNRIDIGDLNLEVRALITRQPDRSLRADWGGAPVLVADGALKATGLVSLDEAISRVTTRQVQGQVLSELQMVQGHIADMALDIDAAALLIYRAGWMKDSGAPRITREAAMAKLFATEQAQVIIDKAVQLHGGDGVRTGQTVERLYREIRALRIYEGASDVQKIIIARQTLGAHQEGFSS